MNSYINWRPKTSLWSTSLSWRFGGQMINGVSAQWRWSMSTMIQQIHSVVNTPVLEAQLKYTHWTTGRILTFVVWPTEDFVVGEWGLLWQEKPRGNQWNCLCLWKQKQCLRELQRWLPPSIIQRWWFYHIPFNSYFGLSKR